MMNALRNLKWEIVILGVLTLGLSPFAPPHIWEKLRMLSQGTLVKPLDWFDLFFHGAPWILLVLKIIATIGKRP